ncbi:transporter substrate-binding domain-containing protein [Roseateles sp.]|uniref:substrate-binding periplasmic protein n=1 Tax=Roseateles sp. TaxID=1971397 RepID=UPI002E003088|nr:transporter substrate-binding domain-containing protein [Roseateles sp.]
MRCVWRRRRLSLALLAWLTLARAGGSAEAPLRFGTDANDHSGLSPAARALLTHALQSLGQQVHFEPLPLRRSLSMTEQGLLDGEAMRIRAVAEEHPNLLLVPVPLVAMEIIGYVRRGETGPADVNALAGWRVGFPRGVVALERLLAQVPRRVEVTTRQDLLRLLRIGAIDVALFASTAGEPDIDAAQTEGLSRLPTPLHTTALYALLHVRHRALLPRLTQVLQQMEASGESARLRSAAWAALRAQALTESR